MAVNPRKRDMEKVMGFREKVDLFFGPIVIPPSLLTSTAPDSQSQRSRSTSCEMRPSSQLTTTPELPRRSPRVPNAPKKQRKATRKNWLKPRKLVYPEVEVEYQNSIDSGTSYKLSSTQSVESGEKMPQSNKQNGKKNLLNCDKENVANIANESLQMDQGYSSNLGQTYRARNLPKRSVLPNCSKLEESSSDGSDISHSGSEDSQQRDRRKLLEDSAGTWIECCSKTCKKWRFVKEFSDPLDVPEKWYCNMNIDPAFASCTVPEEKIPRKVDEQLIENKYCRGSIVWARLDGFPWWPAMVENCPITLLYYSLKGSLTVPNKYHVLFFNSTNGNRAWIPDKDLKSYVQNPRSNTVKKTTFRKINYEKQLDVACCVASEAAQYSIADRIEKFGLVARWFTKNQTTSAISREDRQKTGSTTTGDGVHPRSSKKKCTKSIGTKSAENINSGPSENILSKNMKKKSVDTIISDSSKKTCSRQSKKASIDEKSIETKYNIGDIVWARPNGFPWWPAIIDTCPIVKLHYTLGKVTNIPNEYHLVYFNEEKYETDWRSNRDLKDFASNQKRTVVKQTKFRGKDYSDELEEACALAQKAKLMSPDQRLNRFGVVARWLPHADTKNLSNKTSREKRSSNFELEPESSTIGSKEAWDDVRASMYSPTNDSSDHRHFNFDETNEANAVCSNEIEKCHISNESSISNNEPSTSGVLNNWQKNCVPNESSILNNESSTSVFDKYPQSIEAFERTPASSLSRYSEESSHFEQQPMSTRKSTRKYSDAFDINSACYDKKNDVHSSHSQWTGPSMARLNNNIKVFDSIEISPPPSPSRLSYKLPDYGGEPKAISRTANERSSLSIKSQIIPMNHNEEVSMKSEPEQNDAFSDCLQMVLNCFREEIDTVSNHTRLMFDSNELDIEHNETFANCNYRKYFEREEIISPTNCPWQSDAACNFDEEPMSISDTNNESDSEQSIRELEEDEDFFSNLEDYENVERDASVDFKEESMTISELDSEEIDSHLIFKILEGKE